MLMKRDRNFIDNRYTDLWVKINANLRELKRKELT